MKKNLFIILLIPIFCITGCLPRSLESCSENVLIMPNNPYVRKECRLIGHITGDNIHGERTPFTSEENLLIDDINYLKNKGRNLNANVVVYNQHTTVQTPHWSPTPKHHFYNEITHNIRAEAYICSKDKIRQISYKNINKNRNY